MSGQDGDAAALNRVALGTQTVDVWKDARMLGKAAGEAAVQLCAGTTVDKITGAAPFTTPGGNTLSSILLKPIPITKDNLNVVLDAGWITKADPLPGRHGRFRAGAADRAAEPDRRAPCACGSSAAQGAFTAAGSEEAWR